MVVERLCRTSLELYTPLVLTVPAQHSQDLPWEAEVRCPSPDHKKADLAQTPSPDPEPRLKLLDPLLFALLLNLSISINISHTVC